MPGLNLGCYDLPVFSADGKVLVTIDYAENSIQFRDACTGELRKTLAVNKKMRLVPGLALSADGSTVAVHGATFHGYFGANALKVFDVGSGKELLSLASDELGDKQWADAQPPLPAASVAAIANSSRPAKWADCYPALLALSPDGQRLAWTSEGGFALFLTWDRATNIVRKILNPSPSSYSYRPRLVFSPDSKTLACGTFCAGGGRVLFFDGATGKESEGADLGDWSGQAITFLPDGKTLAVANAFRGHPTDRSQALLDIKMVDLNTRRVCKTHTYAGSSARDGRTLISSSRDAVLWVLSSPHEIAVWDLVTGKEEIVLRDKAGCQAVISPDGRTLVIVQAQGDDKYKCVVSLWRRGGITDTPRK
ncbi:MAG TPA: WD40 repeat domain-containing protein [Gemmataceae bacterium]|nr:WD40 repeat domain-containing protein [Gemmataceae bacterium]